MMISTNCQEYVDPRVTRTRQDVSDAAAELLLEAGPDAVTHARVAAATGYSRTTLYKHWPKRSHLLRAALETIGPHRPDADAIPGDLREALVTMLGELADDLGSEARARLIITMMARAQYDESVAEVRDQMVSEIDPMFRAVIDRAVSQGRLRSGLDARLALASLVGSVMFLKFLANDTIDDRLVERIVDEFIESNAPRP